MNEKKIKHISAYPLSYAQQRIWFLCQLESEALSYNIGSLIVVNEDLEVGVMQSVLDVLVAKHEVLRTNFFLSENDVPVQVVRESLENKLVLYDLSQEANKSKIRKKIIKENSDFYFDLNHDSLARVCLIKLSENKYEIFIVIHHIISDIWSLAIFCNEFFSLYNQKKNKLKHQGFLINQNSVQYKDFAIWERGEEKQGRFLLQEKYWLERFSGELPILDLPTDRSRSWTQTYRTKSETIVFDKDRTSGINFLCQKYKVTSYVLLLAIFKITLHKISNQRDLVVGTYSANRDLPELDGAMGVFLNNIAIRSQINAGESFFQYLQQLKEAVLSAMENKEYPFEKLIEKINPQRDMSRAPIFNTVFQMFSNDDRLRMNFYGRSGSKDFVFDNGTSQFDLILKIFAGDKKMNIVLDYNSWLFNNSSAKKFIQYYICVLDKLVSQPEILISQIEILAATEKEKVLLASGGLIDHKARHNNLVCLFEEQVKFNPKSIALEFYDNKITYKELNQKANQTARYLLTQGVKRGEVVGVNLNRTENLLIAILAILKIGAAYLPLDADLPEKRLNLILNKAKVKFLISEFDAKKIKNIFKIVLNQKEIESQFKGNLNVRILPTDLTYLIFTSGSSGEPKGVKVAHASLLNFISGIKDAVGIRKNHKILSTTNVSFDIFFLESIASLCLNLTVILVDEKERLDPQRLKKIIVDKKVEIVQFTPSYLNILLDGKNTPEWLEGIKKILVGGETLSNPLFVQIKKIYKNQIFNMYGPTETSIWSSVADLTQGKNVNIGYPIANTQIYILDNDFNLCPFAVIGEIYISGQGLALGYLEDSETKKVFVENPFIPGEKMYRTGDLGRRLSDGSLECLGRIDDQVKISGKRVELGEIEAQLTRLFDIRACVVRLVCDDSGKTKLVAYYSAKKEIENIFFRKVLEKNLPTHMIPLVYVFLERFPLNSSGKIDKNILPTPDFKNFNYGPNQLPKSLLEKKIYQIWQEVLDVKNISINDNFFQLGGESLKLIQVYNRLEKEFPGRVSIAQLFSLSTISSLTEYLEGLSSIKLVKNKHYKRKAEGLIEQVYKGKLSADEAAKIFSRLA